MLNWKRLRLYEDFFYSSGNHENAAETVRFFGETALYVRSPEGGKTIPRGVYVFLQSREPLSDDFIDQNRADLESFCFHKNIEIKPDQAVFRTVFSGRFSKTVKPRTSSGFL